MIRTSQIVFKIQANMDPRHRDRIAFVRIVSGEFERGMSVNLPRTGKGAKLSNVTQFMAESVRMSLMPWLEILSEFTIRVPIKLEIP